MFQRKARNPSFSQTFKEDPIPAYKNCNVMASPPPPMSEVKQVYIGISMKSERFKIYVIFKITPSLLYRKLLQKPQMYDFNLIKSSS